jgi:outer membrane lipoprotein-sorting protein
MARMFRRGMLFAILPLAVAAAAPTAINSAEIAQIQAYLNGITTLKARFVQVAPNGALSQGTAWLDRPGRMRFQYDPPSPLLLVAGHGFVVYHDSSLDQTSNIPLGATPLGILLSDHIRLTGGDVTVTDFRNLPGEILMTVVWNSHPSDGGLTLVFATNPLSLRRWVVADATGQRTTVTLSDIQLGGKFDQNLFNYVNPDFFKNHQSNG